MRSNPSRLQYRLGATAGLALLFSIFLSFAPLALATDASDPPSYPSRNHGNLIASDGNPPEYSLLLGSFNGLVIENEVDEAGQARGLELVRRAPEGVSSLGNNQFQTRDIKLGDTQWWYFPVENQNSSESSNSTKRASSTTVYLSLTICSKPGLNTTKSETVPDLPQLDVYVSTSESLQKPGPGKDSSEQTKFPTDEGYMGGTVSADANVYIGVAAPDSSSYSGYYSYQMAASTDAYFHAVNDDSAMLSFVDAGANAALLTTVSPADEGLTTAQLKLWQNHTAVYTLFVNNVNYTALSGMRRSYCALDQHSQVGKTNNVEASMTNRTTEDHGLQEQFYITGLNRSSTYTGIMAMTGNSTSSGNGIIGGGGKVWKPKNFTTKADANCAVIFDLDFCSDVAYAVPSNPSKSLSDLRQIYDDYAKSLYQNFSYSLQQIQCNTSNETIFSMAVNCNDCAAAYKSWLCAVTIPQCTDLSTYNASSSSSLFSSADGQSSTTTSNTNSPNLLIRNAGQRFLNGSSITNQTLLNNQATNTSRNALITTEIQPGPYVEILPSVDYCHNLVKACPMTLGFQCPRGKWLSSSYSPSAAPGRHAPSFRAVARSVSVSVLAAALVWGG
ncbi:hypothetical protein AOCH_006958 [Aspergillus ochraceoroseus]|nr:hypothetical protein AOCH_006958 [Aspergillus ochraceoroseus]